MRKVSLHILIFGLALNCQQVFANSPSAAAEQHYEQALSGLEKIQQMLASTNSNSEEKLTAVLESTSAELQKAAELGHPAAALYQAQLILNTAGYDSKRRDTVCSELESWAKKGFVAAAVMNFKKCDRAYLRFDDANPEHQVVLRALSSSLAGSDPAQAYYPFPLAASQCFAEDPSAVVALTQAQFRTEAEYILGSTQQPKNAEDAKQLVAWLDSSEKHGCQIAMDPRPFLRKLSGHK